MGCCLVGLLWVTDWVWPGDADAVHQANSDIASVGGGVAPTSLRSTGSTSKDLKSKDPATRTGTDLGTGSNLGTGSAVLSSIDDWRRSEERFEQSKKEDPRPIVYPDIATLAPTPDRLQWERQLRYLPANHVYEARAEMPKETTTTKGPTVESSKVAQKTAPRRRHVAHARSARIVADVEQSAPPRYARNSVWNPFGLFD
ncbi:MAG: hypothetical protein NTAFB05_27010 [Nitrobacter sp.]